MKSTTFRGEVTGVLVICDVVFICFIYSISRLVTIPINMFVTLSTTQKDDTL